MSYDIRSLEMEVERLLKEREIVCRQMKVLPKRYRQEVALDQWAKISEEYDTAKQKLEEAKQHNVNEIANVRRVNRRDPINLLANAYKLLCTIRDEFPSDDQAVIENIKQYLIDFFEGQVERPMELVELSPEIISIKSKKMEFSCCNWTGKVSYTDRKHADAQRTELFRQYGKAKGVRTSVYRCQFCKHWHVGRKLEVAV